MRPKVFRFHTPLQTKALYGLHHALPLFFGVVAKQPTIGLGLRIPYAQFGDYGFEVTGSERSLSRKDEAGIDALSAEPNPVGEIICYSNLPGSKHTSGISRSSADRCG